MKKNTNRITKNQSIEQIEQVFAGTAPGALRVQLAGSFTQWLSKPISMTRREDGIWRTAVKLPPGKYHYRFIVDGEWHDDLTCTLRVPNARGSSNMLLEVRAA